MPKTLSIKLAEPGKDVIGVGVGGKEEHADKAEPIGKCELGGNEIGGNEVDDEVEKSSQKTSKSKNLFKFKKTKSGFLPSEARMAFTKLRQAFVTAPIFHHFDPERYIRVETCIKLCYWWSPQSADLRWFGPMASGGLLLSKDDFGWDLVLDSW